MERITNKRGEQIAVEVYDQQITYEKLTYLRNAQMKIRNFVNRNSSF